MDRLLHPKDQEHPSSWTLPREDFHRKIQLQDPKVLVVVAVAVAVAVAAAAVVAAKQVPGHCWDWLPFAVERPRDCWRCQLFAACEVPEHWWDLRLPVVAAVEGPGPVGD